jgi:GGDEF domain-containing protein
LLWLIHPRVPGLGLLALAAALHSTGLFLVVIRPIVPPFVTIILANAIILAGFVAMAAGLTRFVERRPPMKALVALGLGAIGALAWHHYVIESFNVRAIVISGAAAAYLGFGGWQLASGAPEDRRAIHYVVGSALGVGAAVFALRAAVLLVSPEIVGRPFSHPIHAVTFLSAILVTICYVFGIAVIVGRRLQTQLDRFSVTTTAGVAPSMSARLDKEIADVRRTGGRFAVLFVDSADADAPAIERGVVLSPALTALRHELSASDAIMRADDGRYGVILPGNSLEAAMAIGERLLDAVEMISITDPQGTMPSRLAIGAVEVTGNVGSSEAVLAAGRRVIEHSRRAPHAQVTGERVSDPAVPARPVAAL